MKELYIDESRSWFMRHQNEFTPLVFLFFQQQQERGSQCVCLHKTACVRRAKQNGIDPKASDAASTTCRKEKSALKNR